MVRDIDEVHAQDVHTCNIAPLLQQSAHVLADMVAVVQEGDFGRVLASVAEATADASDDVIGLVVDEGPVVFHVVLRGDWIIDHEVHDR